MHPWKNCDISVNHKALFVRDSSLNPGIGTVLDFILFGSLAGWSRFAKGRVNLAGFFRKWIVFPVKNKMLVVFYEQLIADPETFLLKVIRKNSVCFVSCRKSATIIMKNHVCLPATCRGAGHPKILNMFKNYWNQGESCLDKIVKRQMDRLLFIAWFVSFAFVGANWVSRSDFN